MDQKQIINKLREIMDEYESIGNKIWDLERELTETERYQCGCDVEYSGAHTWPCKGRK